ncbi:hypothetical protein D0C36_03630 [Mucilaginibacter conchicola]|uniref:TonB-dependent receptor plug domain-containing protein n=1 Tax=Mucilaginibacter conchicola TaxID=2303333 RepID=A0A372NX05_9SPHI|nr:carboxypeptidase regulatory-like domain-containing protein [Mucilaginibacter conchicola]RFZ94645.1 hypothetical protein D0C36_03630 [Mucilaginibacter conchicola]
MKIYLILIILLFPPALFAQISISGRVLNQNDAKPIANASIFISNATTGSSTDAEGKFSLQNIKPGKYELVISAVGFETDTRPVNVSGTDVSLGDVRLFVKTNSLKEVVVTAKRDPNRQRNYELFKDEFLGSTPFAKDCEITNPQQLDLDYDYKTNILTASTFDALEIKNNALGYRLQYILKSFTLDFSNPANRSFSYAGSVFFKEMEGSPSQVKQWQKNRQLVYEGSQMHFLQALLNNKLDDEGFRVLRLPVNMARPTEATIISKINAFNILKDDDKKYRDSLAHWKKLYEMPRFQQKLSVFPLTANDLVRATKETGIFSLGCNLDALFITYNKYHRFPKNIPDKLSDPSNTDNTVLIFNEPEVQFDSNGSLINPDALVLDGVWLRPRIAGLLPLDYEPPKNEQLIATQKLLQSLSEKLSTYTADNVTEKAYLHLDKPYYAAGDTIYFKAYVTQGEQHLLSQMSGVLNVDLVGPNGETTRSMKLNLNDGLAWGDIAIPDSVKQGTYHLLAYTNYMRNTGSDHIFNKTVPVLNSPAAVGAIADTRHTPPTKPVNATSPARPKFDIQFFPEGGNLLVNTKAVIAVKAINSSGMGIKVKGIITDSKGKEIAGFTTGHAGLGSFTLNAEDNKVYTAMVNLPDGSSREFALPKAENKGYSIIVDNSDEKEIKITAKAGTDSPKDALLVAQAAGVVYYSSPIHANKPLTISNDKFPTGIVQYTLFSAAGEPINERLAFVKHNNNLKIGLLSQQQKYTPRQAVVIDVKAGDQSDEPVSGSFSMAVVDENKVPVNESAESTILSNLLLTSELKGYIEEPNYYFANNTTETRRELDLLMLTQGYRKFVWKQVLSGTHPANALKPQNGLQIAGYLKDLKDNPVANGKVRLMLRDKGTLILDTLADSKGYFVFDNLAFTDTVGVVLQGYKPNGGRDIKFILDNASTPVHLDHLSPDTAFTEAELAYLQTSKQFHTEQQRTGINSQVKMLKAVTVKAQKKAPELEFSQNKNGAGNADFIITSKQIENSGIRNLYLLLSSRVPFVEFTSGGEVYSRRATVGFQNDRMQMLVVLDGTAMPNSKGFNYLSQLYTDDIESVEVLNGTHLGAVYGPLAAGGVFVVTTKKAKKGVYEKYKPGTFSYRIPGFYKAREFYSPRYDAPNINKQNKDLRSTIYWNPNILTDAQGKASVSFFNADTPGNYLVIMEGIDGNGNIGRQQYRYKVE